ncbi:helix-turn-helix transcriptional regulator [Kibdelosporangium persicum]|uniref:helix-turn-helix domain-containing protein n=1 Tax=Kibdelosporangium persicum TaxID=2698649 RepID=UPI001563007A|nr:helix-turn-helix transcriptional regulator [Kibdelosporangium persicum]
MELRRELGKHLAACRTAAGLVQEQLARRVHCDRTTITHLENGGARGDAELWRALDEATNAGGLLVDGYTQLTASQLAHKERVHLDAATAARARVEQLRQLDSAPIETLDGEPDQHGADGQPVFRTVLAQKIRDRRQTYEEFTEAAEVVARERRDLQLGTISSRHLQRLAAGVGAQGRPLGPVRPATARLLEHMLDTSIEELLSPPRPAANRETDQPSTADAAVVGPLVAIAADESAAFLGWVEMVNVGDLSIEQMHTEIRRSARDYLKVPTMPLFQRTKGLRDRSFALLAGHQKPAHGRDLYSVAGWSLTMLAWMSIDLGYPEEAEDHLRAAWVCAERAEENSLRAWVCATRHTAARWNDDFTTAAHYAEQGLQYARNGGSAELFLASALALDLARAGQHEKAQDALTRAMNAAETLDMSQDALVGPFACTIGRAGEFWSDVHIALGQPAEALAIADNAVSTFARTPVHRRNLGSERMVRCRQVQAHLLLGDMDAAWGAFTPVVETAPEHRVQPLVQIVGSIADMTAASHHHAAPIAKDITAAAVDFRRNHAQALLPPA